MKLFDLGATVLVIALIAGGFITAYKTSPEFREGVDNAKAGFDSAYDTYLEPYRDKSEPEWARDAFQPRD